MFSRAHCSDTAVLIVVWSLRTAEALPGGGTRGRITASCADVRSARRSAVSLSVTQAPAGAADRLLGHDNLRLLHVNLLRQQADEYRVLLLFVDRQ